MGQPREYLRLPPGPPKPLHEEARVLCISGGGYRGLFAARLISLIETHELGGNGIAARFNLISGTSIGGIIATAISCGVSGQKITDALKKSGLLIFPPRTWHNVRRLAGSAPYDPKRLTECILELMPEAGKIKLADHAPPLLLTTVNFNTSKLQLLGSKTTRVRDLTGMTLMDAMLATSAAPTYFPPHEHEKSIYVDGGVAANAPDLLALRAIEQMVPRSRSLMLSLGTANPSYGLAPSSKPLRGIGWAKITIELSMHLQEQLAVDECTRLLGTDRYLRLNKTPSPNEQPHLGLDIASAESTSVLTSLADNCFQSLTSEQRQTLAAILG
ncbi:CBASS cGAMP-activated phospholipase [Stenotrophomonas sp. TWI587]|uniref:CBASS cGAMP-activated phospholipase n=1 Tax=Stenotrophomonas sp. TWI587 TaxID=3136783 RepID=UPI00320B8CC8